MAQFLTTHAAAAQIEEIISHTRERLVLVSPFLRLSQIFVERLQDASRRRVSITIVYGKAELAPEQYALLQDVRGLKLFFLANLHAKCYFNESRMVITSMNMYDFSEKTNREMGVLLEAGESAYRDAVAEVESIIAAADAHDPRGAHASTVRDEVQPWKSGYRRAPSARERGVCIRCGHSITLNPDRPLCVEDYGVWAVYANVDYPEGFCHTCGRPADTSMRRPLCHSCFREFGYR